MTKNIIIYTIAGCPHCEAAKNYLKSKNVSFTGYDVLKDPSKAKEMIKKSGQKLVPVLDIDGTILVRPSEEKINAALGI